MTWQEQEGQKKEQVDMKSLLSTNLYSFECHSSFRHPKCIEDHKVDGGEAEKCNKGEGREHLFGSEGAPSCHIYCEHQPHDESD